MLKTLKNMGIAAALGIALAACATQETRHTEWKTLTKDDGNGPVVLQNESQTTVTKQTSDGRVISSSTTSSGPVDTNVGGTR